MSFAVRQFNSCMQQPVSGRHLAAIIIMHFWKEKSHYNTSIFLPPLPKNNCGGGNEPTQKGWFCEG